MSNVSRKWEQFQCASQRVLKFGIVLLALFGRISFGQTPTPTPTTQSPVRINCGGPAYLDKSGQSWSGDIDFVGGSTKTYTQSVSGTSDPKLYQSERFAPTLTYNIPVINGTYNVTLYFAEMYFNAAGQRVFSVSLEGQTVLQNFDIWAVAGQFAAVQRSFVVTVTDGVLNIVAPASVNSAKFSAIQVGPGTPTPTPTPTPTATPTATPTPTPTTQSTVRINSGGPAYLDGTAQSWSADIYFVGGSTKTYTQSVSGTSDPTLYQSERYAPTLTYNVPVPNGNYEVTLYFAEMAFNAAGKRVFSVSLEGQTVLQNFDIWAVAGQFAAVQRTFIISVTDGVLNIVGTATVNNAKFSAIQILPKFGDPYLHPVLTLPTYVVDYDGNGSEIVSLNGDLSHTHESGHQLTSWTWTEGATLLGNAADIDVPFPLGQHTVTLTIGDDNVPQHTASDQGTFNVYPINAVGGLLTNYYLAGSVPLATLIDSLPSSANYEEVLPSLRIDPLGGDIGGSPYTSNVVAVMDGVLSVPTTATYQFTLTGGSATRFFVNGNLITGPISLQAGSYTVEARFAIDSSSLLPAQVLASINGAPAVAIDAKSLSHDETHLQPFINDMPVSGSPQGGEAVIISGIGFFPSASVMVHWGAITLSQQNITVAPNSIQLIAPSGSGTVAVTVETPNGISNSFSYNYVEGVVPISFAAPTTVATLTAPTQAAWGPDGRLYVGSDQGNITIYTFADDYTVTDTQVVTTIANLSNKAILGLAFNPADPPSPVKIYVGHAHLYAEGGGAFTGPAPYNGQISVLTGPSFSSVQPIITGLPVSNHDHAINGVTFNNEGDLLFSNGSNTNAGIPSDAMGTLPESPLSAAILKARVTKPNFHGSITYTETATGLINNDQVYGGIVDVVPDTDVSVYVPGLRNCWDIVWTTREMLYGSDNGADPTFGYSSTSATTQGPQPDAPDEINYLVEGHYYGSPNRNRGRYDDRQNVYHLPTDSETFGQYNGSPTATVTSSTDGIDEYRATTFNSEMRGNLLAQHWKGQIYRGVLAPDGRSLQSVSTLAQPLGLDVLAGPGGVIFSTDYTNNKIVLLKPIDSAATGMVAYDIFPWRARADGSVPFTIGGVGFGSLADTTVAIGGLPATLTSVSPTRIKGLIPANSSPSAQLLDVTVRSAGATSSISQGFRYMQGTSQGAGIWNTGPALPISVGEVSSGVVNGVLYLVGGDTTATMAYDLKTGIWRSDLAVRPYTGNHHSAEVINGKLYLFGGLDSGQGQVQIYDPAANAWTLGTPAPWAAGSMATAFIGGKVYAAGGIVGTTTVNTAGVYDPATNTWSSIPAMPVGRNHTAAGTDGLRFFIFGGRTGGNVVSIGFNDVQIYDPASNTWQWSGSAGSTIPPLPQPRGGMGKAAFYGNEFYVMGGETTSSGTGQVTGNVYNRVDVYNPTLNTWRLEAAMPTARHGISPFVSDGKILVGGGGVQAGHSNSTVFELFSR